MTVLLEFDSTGKNIDLLQCIEEYKKTWHLKFLMRWHTMIFISILARLNPIHALCIMFERNGKYLLKVVCI